MKRGRQPRLHLHLCKPCQTSLFIGTGLGQGEERVRLDLAHPGEPCRSGRLADGIVPCAKGEVKVDFPGVLGTG